jgi:cell division protein ZapA
MEYKNMVSVKVCGRTMTLTGNESVEYITKVANYIEEKAAQLRASENSKTLSPTMVSVLTSINIADDFFKAKKTNEELEKLVKNAGIENSAEKVRAAENAEKYLNESKELSKRLDEAKATIEKYASDLEIIKKELEETKNEAQAAKSELDSLKNSSGENDSKLQEIKAENEKLVSENESLKVEAESLKAELSKCEETISQQEAQLSEQVKKYDMLQEDNVKKIAQINHFKSIESRLLSFEKQEQEHAENEPQQDGITQETEEEEALGSINMNSNKFRKAHTQNQNYYRHV